jgi:TatD DNase family protein
MDREGGDIKKDRQRTFSNWKIIKMIHPLPGDYIDIHTHGSDPVAGIYAIENLMAHEGRAPADIPFQPCTFGIHPWHLNIASAERLIAGVKSVVSSPNLVAVGEAGFDKLRGPAIDLQEKIFREQVLISEEVGKPLFIHCVRAWDELLPLHKKMRPKMPWLIHGFRGNTELADQLLAKGMYLSFWFDFVLKPESAKLLKNVPKDRILLETDGAEADIRIIYEKVAGDLDMSVGDLKSLILKNMNTFFDVNK